MFWSMNVSAPEHSEVTLCEEHALEATNVALAILGEQGFPTMQVAALVIDSLLAINGREPMGFRASEEGFCGDCAENAGESA